MWRHSLSAREVHIIWYSILELADCFHLGVFLGSQSFMWIRLSPWIGDFLLDHSFLVFLSSGCVLVFMDILPWFIFFVSLIGVQGFNFYALMLYYSRVWRLYTSISLEGFFQEFVALLQGFLLQSLFNDFFHGFSTFLQGFLVFSLVVWSFQACLQV